MRSACSRFRLGVGTCVIGLGLVLGACSPRIDQRGNHPDEDLVVQINPGVDDKFRVAEILGSPSAITTFGDKSWYYISKRTETTAFFEPDTVDQQVLEIRFDDQDLVQSLRIYGPEDGREIALVDRETPTEGNELTVLQQLLGNLGRFNPTGDDAPAPY